MTNTKKLSAAINAIGVFFTETYEHEDPKTGEVSERNRLGFIQDKVLNGICYQLANALDYSTNKTLPDAQARVKRAMRNHDGTELSELELNRALDWVDRINDQMVLVEAALKVAKHQYEKHTGRDFSYGRRPVANEGVAETLAMERARKLVGATNVAADHNSNRQAA